MRRLGLVACALAVLGTSAFGKGTPKKDKAKDDEADAADDEDKKPDKADKPDADAEPDPDADPDAEDKPAKKSGGDQQDKDFAKQDLNGHDLGTQKKENEFEKDRFYVDKIDNEKTQKGTLIQGSLASSSFFYTESGGNYPGNLVGSDAGKYSRYFTDLRLQTDFRHIGSGRWDARFDGRVRMVNTPTGNDPLAADPAHIQSGFNGRNEYELREAWIIRNGIRSDVLIGRQFIPDLGAIKIDGVRIDYAQSKQLTLLGFGGLYPIRGSRSINTDYQPLRDDAGTLTGSRVVGAGGFGGAYRTINSYGSLGGVALVPTAAEAPRVYATSSGYYRAGPTLDFYHFALVDLIAQSGASLTNLSAGINYKPSQRLRVTANVNRVDTDTLNVQARAFLDPADPTGAGANTIQNETFIKRLATNSARGGISAGLGPLQRFELSTAITVRERPAVALSAPVIMGVTPTTVTLQAAKGVDLYAALTDRHSIKDARLGLDVSRTFGIGAVPYQRTEVLAVRVFAAHEIKDGRGEWEAEVSYATTKDVNAGTTCTAGTLDTCFGSTTNTILSAGGNVYYRLTRDWFVLASLNVAHQATKTLMGAAVATDPAILGLTGFGRIAYRF